VTTIAATEARNKLPEIIDRVAYGHERVCLTKHGKEMACVVSMEEMKILEALEDFIDLKDAREALESLGAEGTVTWVDFKKELGL
jgi:prevent-host-death family protein